MAAVAAVVVEVAARFQHLQQAQAVLAALRPHSLGLATAVPMTSPGLRPRRAPAVARLEPRRPPEAPRAELENVSCRQKADGTVQIVSNHGRGRKCIRAT